MAGCEHGLNPTKPGGKHPKAGPSFKVSHDKVIEYDPDIIIVCPCGLDLNATIRETKLISEQDWWKKLNSKPRKIALVDGNQVKKKERKRKEKTFL